jgi:hypothetical protein
MTTSDIIQYVQDIAPDISATPNKLLNFLDASIRRITKKVLWPDCWMTTQTIAGQQEYTTLPVLQVNAVYVGGVLATPTDRATLEGRQIGLYSSVSRGEDHHHNGFPPGPVPPFPPGPQPPPPPFGQPFAVFHGYGQLGGFPTTGDIITTTVGGISVPYTVLYTDTDLQILALSIVRSLRGTVALQSLIQVEAVTAFPVQVYITQLPNTGPPLTLSVSVSLGATETYVASGPVLAGHSNGTGGAPGTFGPGAPAWVIAQEPYRFPDFHGNWNRGGIRPDAQPWGHGSHQMPRYYWRGGRVAIVPNTCDSGVTIALDCVRSPDQITTLGQEMTAPIDWREALAADVLRQAYMGDADSKHVQLAQMWEASYKDYEKEILLWRGTFEGEGPGSYKMQTQRFRMGLTGGARFNRRRR